jgi:hypothetical protein
MQEIVIYVDHLAWPLVVGALLVIAKRGAQEILMYRIGNTAGPFILVRPPTYTCALLFKPGLWHHNATATSWCINLIIPSRAIKQQTYLWSRTPSKSACPANSNIEGQGKS